MGMACTLFRLTPEEALRGATAYAARALGLDDRGLLAAAAAFGLDGRDLERAWQTYRLIPRVKEDFRSGLDSGVSGTPKFFVNGVRHDGPSTFAELSAALEAARHRPDDAG
jgi:2-hydroxychromene-2-carboxylate isomerase